MKRGETSLRRDGAACSVDSCSRPARRGSRQLCAGHLTRVRRTGAVDPGTPLRDRGGPPLERLMRRVNKDAESGCWNWTGPLRKGYGSFTLGKMPMGAYRAAWILMRGDIPDGYHIDHLCRNRACINPAHLEPVTPTVNAARAYEAVPVDARPKRPPKAHCKRGHPFSGENLGRRTDGGMKCKQCMRDYQRAYLSRKKPAE